MSVEKDKGKIKQIKDLKDLLLWKRCVFMTFDQYKKKREHINPRMYCYEALTDNIEKHVVEHLKALAERLPFNKVPLPVYVLLAKHLEYDAQESILPTDCKKTFNLDFDFIKKEYEDDKNTQFADSKYDSNIPIVCHTPYRELVTGKLDYDFYKNNPKSFNYDISCFRDMQNDTDGSIKFISPNDAKILSYKNTYEKNEKLKHIRENINISCLQNEKGGLLNREVVGKYKFIYNSIENNKEELLKSSVASFKFKGLYEVIIYIPNLNKDLQYFTSFLDFSYQNRWMNILVSKHSKHLTVIELQKEFSTDIIKIVGEETYKQNKDTFATMIANMNEQSKQEFPLIKDLTHICYNMGCSSPYGEDMNELVPTVSKTYDDQLNNARAKGPYYPKKCLKTEYYEKHMMKMNADYNIKVKEDLLKNVDTFKSNYEKIQRGELPTEQSSTNLIDVIKGTANKHRNATYKEGTRNNEYSKEYNRKIMTELAFRHNTYPGVQEITFPAFRLNETYEQLVPYIHLMPWGNILLKDEYVLNEGDVLKIDELSLKSFNKIYELKFDAVGSLSLFNAGKKTKTIVAGGFSKYGKKSLVLENGSLNIYGYENGNNDNRHSLYVSNANAISPLSIVIENSGVINVYDNGLNEIGYIDSDGFKEYHNK